MSTAIFPLTFASEELYLLTAIGLGFLFRGFKLFMLLLPLLGFIGGFLTQGMGGQNEELPLAMTAVELEEGRRRMLEKATGKYMFRVEELAAPEALITEDYLEVEAAIEALP